MKIILTLPREIWFKIFDFFDLTTWKHSRGVCHQWNKFLCDFTFASKFPLKIQNCVIRRGQPPFSIFEKTFSIFTLVEIHQRTSWKSEGELLEFLHYIGRGTIKLKFDCLRGVQYKCLALRSFPNLEKFYSTFHRIDIELLLTNTTNLKEINVWNISFESVLDLPEKHLKKLSNVEKLCIEGYKCLEEDKFYFEKFPNMSKLKELKFLSEENSFRSLRHLFERCANLEIIILDNFYGLNLDNVVAMFKLWPKMREFKVFADRMEVFDSKVFIDSIAEFSKNLEILDLRNNHLFRRHKTNVLDDEFKKYAMEKIPSLKGFT